VALSGIQCERCYEWRGMCSSVVAEGRGRGSLGARCSRGGIEAGRWVACDGITCEPCARWRGLRDNVLLGRVALGSLGEVAVGYGGKVLGAP
jgi:hypothetical protein